MITLTKAIVDVADCNITLRYLHGVPVAGTMPFGEEEPYGDLYQQIAEKPRTYGEVAGQPGSILAKLSPVYAENKFWVRYLVARTVKDYPGKAWSNFVPISSTLAEQVDVVLPKEFADLTVRPVPRVLLYPFGWSTWLSLLLAGSYSLVELGRAFEALMTEKVYRLSSKPEAALDLSQLLGEIGSRVQQDAFHAAKVDVMTPPDLLTVTTVLAKGGGGVSLGALSAEQEGALQKLIRPGKPPLHQSVATTAETLPAGGDPLLDYVLHDGMSWFLWVEHLLWPEGRLAKQLRCYHNNTFRSLLQASVFQTLFRRAAAVKPWSDGFSTLLDGALTLLDSSEGLNDYKNRSLVSFLQQEDFRKAVERVRKRLVPPAPAS